MENAAKITNVLSRVTKHYKVEPAHLAERQELVNFFKAAYVDQFNATAYQDEKYIMERWEWVNINSPHRFDIALSAWICRENSSGKIVGHFGVMPVSIKYKDNHYPAVWGRDLVVLPEFRKLGIGPFLVASVLGEVKSKAAVFLIAGLNDYVYTIYKKFGFTDMGYIPLYVRINRLKLIIRTKVRNKLLTRFLNILGNCAVKIIYIPSQILRHIYGRRKDFFIAEIAYFDEFFDKLWESSSSLFNIAVKRDSTHLNWRFVNQPYWKYKIFKASKKDCEIPIGYIVLREGQSRGVRTGVITDIFAAANNSEIIIFLINFAIAYFGKRDDIAIVRCDILNKDFECALKKCGFINMPSRSHFMFTNVGPELNPEFFVNRDNWFIDYADSDLDLSGQRIG